MTRKNRGGFTLVEVMITVSIMAIMASVLTFSTDFTKQTAKREAQRLFVFLYRSMNKADSRRINFTFIASPAHVLLNWGNGKYEKLIASKGCAYSNNFPGGECTYNARNRRCNTGGTITVLDSEGKKYYVVLAGITEGRIRLSETRP